jgi:hypothetical protein
MGYYYYHGSISEWTLRSFIMPRQKFDDFELIAALNLHNGNISRAAQDLGVSRAAVIKRKKTLPEGVIAPSVKEFREQRADTFARLQQILLQHITPQKLKGASLAQIGTLFGIMYDKERLEKNLATEHIAHAHYQMLNNDQLSKVKQLAKDLTEQKLKEITYD